jgi:hypothetical protein
MVLQVGSFEEFKERLGYGERVICDHMLKAIKRGLSKNYNKVKVFAFEVEDEPGVRYDFFLESHQWPLTLEGILESYTREELYELCQEVYDIIKNNPQINKLRQERFELTPK